MLAKDSKLMKELNDFREREQEPILKSINNRTIGGKYSSEIKNFALALAFYSKKGYDFVRKEFGNRLPEISTIRKWQAKVDGSPGFTLSAIPVIKKKIKEAKENGKHLIFSLMMDEMKLSDRLELDKAGKTWGFEEFGQSSDYCKKDGQVATEALVYMIVCSNERWKMPIAYYLVKPLDKNQKHDITLEVFVITPIFYEL